MGTSYPHAVLEKLVEACGVAFLRLAQLPDGAIRSVKSEFTDPKPVVLRADHVFYVGASSPYTVAAEIQLHIDDDKPAAWTGYLAFLFRKYQCPAELVVLTNSPEVEVWARKPISVSRDFSWTPTVLELASTHASRSSRLLTRAGARVYATSREQELTSTHASRSSRLLTRAGARVYSREQEIASTHASRRSRLHYESLGLGVPVGVHRVYR